MEQFLNNKKYLLIFILFIVLLIIIITYFMMTSGSTTQPENSLQPSASPIPVITTTNPSAGTNSTPVTTPLPFTGAKDIEFTETEINEINEERNLRRSTPYNGGTFVVTYNPVNDLFEVALTQPKENAQNDFEIWRKIDYPDVSFERFTFK